MSLYLCHACFAWCEPRLGRCVECSAPLDPSEPDPSAESLAAAIGPWLLRLGAIRVKRRERLPRTGSLYATAGGLFFVPQGIEANGSHADTLPQPCDLLMREPAAFFVPRSSLKGVRSGWFRWRIERQGAVPVFFQVESSFEAESAAAENGRGFRTRLRTLADRPDWQAVRLG